MARAVCPGCDEVQPIALTWAGQGWCSEECLRDTVDQENR